MVVGAEFILHACRLGLKANDRGAKIQQLVWSFMAISVEFCANRQNSTPPYSANIYIYIYICGIFLIIIKCLMRTNTKIFISLLAVLVVATLATTASAYDFMYDDLCYKITDASAKTVMLTYQRTYADTNGSARYDYINGVIDIPETVLNNNIRYTVTAIDDNAMRSCKNFVQLRIPATVTSIGKHAFQSCSGLTDIVFKAPSDGSEPQPLSIGDQAFYYCHGLTYVNLSGRVSSIGNQIFEQCRYLKTFNVSEPSNLTSIGERAFYSCYELENVNLPNSVTSIGANAFNNTGVKSLSLPDNLTTVSLGLCSNCSKLSHVVLPANLATIEQNAFSGIGNSSTDDEVVIELPSSLTTIGERAFNSVKKLKTITIPSGVTTLGSNAFSQCEGLSSVNIQNAVIGVRQFSSCKGLKSVTIPSSVKTIENEAFNNCTELENLTIEADLTSVADGIFTACAKLKTLNVKSNTFKISMFPELAEQLTSATYDGVTTIAEGSLEGSIAMEKITIPATVKKIENSAFKGCTALGDFVSLLPKPIVIDASVFEGVPVKGYCDLHVVEGSKGRYQAMDVWKDFYMITEDAGSGGGSGGTGNKYDVNEDGNVDVGDVNSILTYILEN